MSQENDPATISIPPRLMQWGYTMRTRAPYGKYACAHTQKRPAERVSGVGKLRRPRPFRVARAETHRMRRGTLHYGAFRCQGPAWTRRLPPWRTGQSAPGTGLRRALRTSMMSGRFQEVRSLSKSTPNSIPNPFYYGKGKMTTIPLLRSRPGSDLNESEMVGYLSAIIHVGRPSITYGPN